VITDTRLQNRLSTAGRVPAVSHINRRDVPANFRGNPIGCNDRKPDASAWRLIFAFSNVHHPAPARGFPLSTVGRPPVISDYQLSGARPWSSISRRALAPGFHDVPADSCAAPAGLRNVPTNFRANPLGCGDRKPGASPRFPPRSDRFPRRSCRFAQRSDRFPRRSVRLRRSKTGR
jgi:hypothetical protein